MKSENQIVVKVDNFQETNIIWLVLLSNIYILRYIYLLYLSMIWQFE